MDVEIKTPVGNINVNMTQDNIKNYWILLMKMQ